MEERSQSYLNEYLRSLPHDIAEQYTSFSADYFCADEHNANLCAELILKGEKRASCSLEYWYRNMGELMPTAGHLQVVTNWEGQPVCIIEITSVSTCPFNKVTAEFAAKEGEGDKTLAWWQRAHWRFFSRECEELGIKPTENMPLVLEHFSVVYPKVSKSTPAKNI
ncbi:ASCH domain-containing protein [Veronia pacifica]|uniref:RNA-binding protein n=1 Tax=Veronia pacifica TaxID=1080227 RepID=A0A1C3ECL0_9GAMM|nr:ASCH domain-containing protein [Veronia pacifica]ODA30924.1 RNA-binding protein [Veronia pacifica]